MSEVQCRFSRQLSNQKTIQSVQVVCLFWNLRTVAFQTTGGPAAAISTLHPGNRQYLVPPTGHPADGGRVKEHPFGVCDACRWSCRGKSRVAALNCMVPANTRQPPAKRATDRPIKPMTFYGIDDNGNAAFSWSVVYSWAPGNR